MKWMKASIRKLSVIGEEAVVGMLLCLAMANTALPSPF